MAVRCVYCPLKTPHLLPPWLMDSTLLLCLFYGSLCMGEHQIFVTVYCQLRCCLCTVKPTRPGRGGHRKCFHVHLTCLRDGWWLSRKITARKGEAFEMYGQSLGTGGNIRFVFLYFWIVLELCFGGNRLKFSPGYRL
jgi:hypothetical protein